jgi:hypothetical protein
MQTADAAVGSSKGMRAAFTPAAWLTSSCLTIGNQRTAIADH